MLILIIPGVVVRRGRRRITPLPRRSSTSTRRSSSPYLSTTRLVHFLFKFVKVISLCYKRTLITFLILTDFSSVVFEQSVHALKWIDNFNIKFQLFTLFKLIRFQPIQRFVFIKSHIKISSIVRGWVTFIKLYIIDVNFLDLRSYMVFSTYRQPSPPLHD